jgi:GT2 family glycosyltransferase
VQQIPVYSVIIPTYGEGGYMLLCNLLPVLRYSCRLTHEIVVVDDGSDEKVAEKLDGLCSINGATLIHSEKNGGFSVACNAGMSVSNGHVVILMNNDVIPIGDAIDSLADFIMFLGHGIAGCKLLYPDNRIQHAGVHYVDPDTIPVKQGDKPPERGWFDHIGRFGDRWHPDVCRITTRLVTGALLAIHGNMISSVGMLDTRFGMACEDVDFCLRVFEAGSLAIYNGRIEAYHLEGATRGNTPESKLQHPEWTNAEDEGMKKLFDKWAGLDFRQFSIARG